MAGAITTVRRMLANHAKWRLTVATLLERRCSAGDLAGGWCRKDSPKNGCKSCQVEADCGNTAGGTYYCLAEKDSACPNASASLASGWCNHNSPKNACKSCQVEADCGNTAGKAAFCWAEKDVACPSAMVV